MSIQKYLRIAFLCVISWCLMSTAPKLHAAKAKKNTPDQESQVPDMTFQQARNALAESVKYHSCPQGGQSDFKLQPGAFEFSRSQDPSPGPFVIRFVDLNDVTRSRHNRPRRSGDPECSMVLLNFRERDTVITNSGETLRSMRLANVSLTFDSEDIASEFMAAANWFLVHANDPQVQHLGEGLTQEAATAWQKAPVKPAMPEAAHEHQVLAANAYQEKNFNKAIEEYELALAIFPTWPEGQNNVAFLCGETGEYDCAIEHAQDYLLLLPNVPNAQALKDQIIIWKDKLAQRADSAAPQASAPRQQRVHGAR
jgi:tetratricopeptide (TPR) repeat protein